MKITFKRSVLGPEYLLEYLFQLENLQMLKYVPPDGEERILQYSPDTNLDVYVGEKKLRWPYPVGNIALTIETFKEDVGKVEEQVGEDDGEFYSMVSTIASNLFALEATRIQESLESSLQRRD